MEDDRHAVDHGAVGRARRDVGGDAWERAGETREEKRGGETGEEKRRGETGEEKRRGETGEEKRRGETGEEKRRQNFPRSKSTRLNSSH